VILLSVWLITRYRGLAPAARPGPELARGQVAAGEAE
jgi:hypothetical protein